MSDKFDEDFKKLVEEQQTERFAPFIMQVQAYVRERQGEFGLDDWDAVELVRDWADKVLNILAGEEADQHDQ